MIFVLILCAAVAVTAWIVFIVMQDENDDDNE